MNYAQIIIEYQVELERLESAQKLVQFQKRIRFLRLLKTGEAATQEAAGKLVGWQKRQSQKIWALYRRGAIEEVLRKPQRYWLGKLSSQEIVHLQSYLREFGASSLSEVCGLIEQIYDISYTQSGVCVLLQRLKIKLKTAGQSNAKKDEAAALEYKKTLAH